MFTVPPEHDISRRAGEALGLVLEVACVTAMAGAMWLSAAECARAEGMKGRRRDEWLRGRAALKKVLNRFRLDDDTAAISFPSPTLSLTHGGKLAIAVGTNQKNIAGLGVDFEPERCPRPETARFFLSPAEQAWLGGLCESERPRHLRRLWTVKEAVFKADPENHTSTLLDYRLDAPGKFVASAQIAHGIRHREFAYISIDSLRGTISVATCRKTEAEHA